MKTFVVGRKVLKIVSEYLYFFRLESLMTTTNCVKSCHNIDPLLLNEETKRDFLTKTLQSECLG